MTNKKIAARLDLALSSGSLTLITSASEPKRPFPGFVVALSEQFVVMQFVDKPMLAFNGYVVFPLREVVRVKPMRDYNSFCRRALTVKGLKASEPRSIQLDSYADLLASIDAHFPLMMVYTERLDPRQLSVGRVAKLTKGSVRLRQIDRAAHWTKIVKYRYRDITRIDFAGAYEDALWRVSENERSIAEKAQGAE